MLVIDPGSADEGASAPFRFLGSEPTLIALSSTQVDQAQRLVYRAENSGAVYSLTLRVNLMENEALIARVAGLWAWRFDQLALVPGVTDVEETQEVTSLGTLEDVAQVAVTSTSGRSTAVLTLKGSQMYPDYAPAIIEAQRQRLDAIEAQGL